MNKKPVCFLFSLLLIFSEVSVSAKSGRLFPLNKPLIRKLKKQGQSLMSERVGGYVLRAEDLASAKKYDQAIELLQYHYKREGLSRLEKAHFAMHLGYLYRQNKNQKDSLLYLQKALDSKALPYPQHLSALYFAAQIHVEEERYKKALKLLKFWFSVNENPHPQAYVLMAYCHYAEGRLDTALKYVEKSLSLVDQPMESWLSFASAIYLKQKHYKKARPYLERLTALYPASASHWKQLAGVYLYLDQTKKAFVTLDMAYRMGHLKSRNDYLNLSSLYIEHGMPYQGAKLLKIKIDQKIVPKEQKQLELLAEAFWMAREGKQSLTYLKEASKHAVQPLFFIRYGQKLLDQEQWQSAEKAFKKALNTKEMKETIKALENYKRELALAYRKENNLKQSQFFKAQLSAKESSSGKEDEQKNKAEAQPALAEKEAVPENELSINQKALTEKEGASETQLESASIKAPPTNYLEHLYLGIGIAFYQQKKYEEALSYFRKSIEVDDTFLSGYQWIDYTETSITEKQKRESSEVL